MSGCLLAYALAGRARGVGDFLLVKVDDGLELGASIRVFRPALYEFADGLGVVAVGLGFGVNLTGVFLDLALRLVLAFDAFDDGEELLAAHPANLSGWGLARGPSTKSFGVTLPSVSASKRSMSSRRGVTPSHQRVTFWRLVPIFVAKAEREMPASER